MLTYLLPTRDRPQLLERTLQALGALEREAHDRIGGGEVIVVDNASRDVVQIPKRLANGMPVQLHRLNENLGAAARNIGGTHARGEWIVMLDDDSFPIDCGHIDLLVHAQKNVAAIGAEIVLRNGEREAGGLPEVFIGCGVAIRTKAFFECGGYDRAFDYYAEEYDLCAKLILNGWRIEHDFRFRVRHEKSNHGRDMNRILHRLVRNNGWVAYRYAPIDKREGELAHIVNRYAQIAMKEGAAMGFAAGMADLSGSLSAQPRCEMTSPQWARFSGEAQVCEALAMHASRFGARRFKAAIVARGKHAAIVERVLLELGVRVVDEASEADFCVIGTLSPGPMMDAYDLHARGHGTERIILPWQVNGFDVHASSENRRSSMMAAV